MLKKVILLFGFLLIILNLYAQDIHFSQYFHTQLFINPSYTGLNPGMCRVSLNAKNQWLSVTKPYQTYLAGYENVSKPSRNGNYFFSYGSNLFYDVTGDSRYTNTQVSPYFSLSFLPSQHLSSLLSFFVQPSFTQRSMDYSELYFDNQFENGLFNPSAETKESTGIMTLFYPDFATGLNYISFFNKKNYISGGFSIFHLLNPSVSMKNAEKDRIKNKIILNAEANLGEKGNSFFPSFMFAKQGKHTEILLGARTLLNRNTSGIENNLLFRKNVLLGLYYRVQDALILYVGTEYQQFAFGLTYDINMSKLTPASDARGGIEISVSYVWQKNKNILLKEISCPIF